MLVYDECEWRDEWEWCGECDFWRMPMLLTTACDSRCDSPCEAGCMDGHLVHNLMTSSVGHLLVCYSGYKSNDCAKCV